MSVDFLRAMSLARLSVVVPGATPWRRSAFAAAVLLWALPSAPGWAQATPDIHPGSDTAELETVIVTANPLGRTADELVQPVVVLSGEDLARLRAPTIGETLSSQPGISSTSFGAGASRPVIRGQAGSRVQVLENGLGSLDVSDVSPDHAVTVSPAQATQVEVIKGPAALLYGNGASGGIVNVNNDRLPATVTPGFHGVLDAGYSGNGDQRHTMVDVNAGVGESGQLHADYGWSKSGNYDVPGPVNADGSGVSDHQPNSATETHNGAVSYAQTFGDSVVAGSVSRMLSTYGLPNEETAFIKMDQTRYDLLALIDRPFAGAESLRLRAAYNDYKHTEFEDVGEPGTNFINKQHQERVELTHVPIAGWHGTLGATYDHRDFQAIGEEALVPNTLSQQGGLFLIEEHALDWGRVELGGRYDRVDYDPAGHDDQNFDLVNLSAGLIVDLSANTHLKANVAQSQRAPSPEDLYAYGAHIATAAFERGDADADIETGRNFEIGLDHHDGRWRVDASLWYELFDDYLYQAGVDEGLNADGSGTPGSDGVADRVNEEGEFDPEGELTLYDITQQDAKFWGYELETEYALLQGAPASLTVRAFTDGVWGELDGGDNLPRITPRRYGLELHGGYGAWHASVDYTRVDKVRDLAALETPTSGYNRVGMDLSYHFQLGDGASDESEIYLRADNLLDEEARVATSFIKDSVLLPGRSIMAGVRLAI